MTDTTRRDFLAAPTATGATVLLGGKPAVAAEGRSWLFVLHTNDLHSNLIGMGPSSDYSPLKLNDDKTLGGSTLVTATSRARS